MSEEDDKLQRVLVDLPNHWATGGESMWAFLLEDGTYQIDNVPFYAFGINYKDIVMVDTSDPKSLPVVSEVVRFSGHETISYHFFKRRWQEKTSTCHRTT